MSLSSSRQPEEIDKIPRQGHVKSFPLMKMELTVLCRVFSQKPTQNGKGTRESFAILGMIILFSVTVLYSIEF